MESAAGGKCLRIDGAEPAGANDDVVNQVYQTLARNSHFTHHWREFACEYQDGILTLRGSVPSFYLKQLLQSALLKVPGVLRINNQVDVVAVDGLSSVPRM